MTFAELTRDASPEALAAFESNFYAAKLLRSCEVEASGSTVRLIAPAGTTFDAAEALRLQVAKLVGARHLDVVIQRSPAGALSPEDAAGFRLFETCRAQRLVERRPGDIAPLNPELCDGAA